MEYTIKWRRTGKWYNLLWKKEKKLMGHKWDKEQNKMILYYSNGGIKEIADWTKCEIWLGTDWVLWTKHMMEKESGQTIPLNINVK